MKFKMLKELTNDNEFIFNVSNDQEKSNIDTLTKDQDQPDIISMDVPTLLRVVEWAHEEAEDDVILHRFVNELIQRSFKTKSPLNMDDYELVCQSVCNKTKQID